MDGKRYTDIRVQNGNGIVKISINRPEKLNAIRIQTYRELTAALKAADAAPECHVITLAGEGGQFTAGNDLADLVSGEKHEVSRCVQEIFDTVAGLKKVLVAGVEGVAVGIGTTLLLHCDIVVASEKARFRLPFANLGVCPEGGSSVLLPRAIGEKMAREVLLTGRFFSAEEALSWGMLNSVVPPAQVWDKIEEYLELLMQQPLDSLLATKELMRPAKGDVGSIVAGELQVFERLLNSEATSRRIRALLK